MNSELLKVADDIRERSVKMRTDYLAQMKTQHDAPSAQPLSCGNRAHAIAAASNSEKNRLLDSQTCNVGIVTAYNDMLSAHHPYALYPDQIKKSLNDIGHTAQVAGGVPAMCDGITQGQPGMEMSLFSRDLIAQTTALSLSHNVFDAILLLGICDKIAPGLLIGALSHGHLPCAFVPAGPMATGISNDEKVIVRQKHAAGQVDESALLKMECQGYHSEGTCTFYGTANTNQLVFEAMGLMLPGSAFVPPFVGLRAPLTKKIAQKMPDLTAKSKQYRPLMDIVDERNLCNGVVGLLASGGSTNHTLHLPAIARAAGFQLTWDDIDRLSRVVPQLTKIYPNGPADINAFQQAGGVPTLLSELNQRGLLFSDALSVSGTIKDHLQYPILNKDIISYRPADTSRDPEVIASPSTQFHPEGGIKLIEGNLGRGIIKTSALSDTNLNLRAPVKIFHSQEDVLTAYQQKKFTEDCFVVVRFNGPRANGMPELHQLIPSLSNVMAKGIQVVLLTDGRLSGASGKVPAILHFCPEAADGGAIAKLQNDDVLSLDLATGTLHCETELAHRDPQHPNLTANQRGFGRELFAMYRQTVSSADTGASLFFTEQPRI